MWASPHSSLGLPLSSKPKPNLMQNTKKLTSQSINQCPKQPFERLKKEREEGVYNQNNGLEHTEQKNGLFLFRIAEICWRTNVYSFFYQKIDFFRHLPLS